jgi:hypothetical protein
MSVRQAPAVRALAYIGVAVDDPAAWLRFGTEVLGAMPADAADGANRLRIDQRGWRIAVQQGPQNDLSFAGFEVASEADLAAARRGPFRQSRGNRLRRHRPFRTPVCLARRRERLRDR